MFEPPSGLADMAGDAELAADRPPHPVTGLSVEGVGVVQARRPLPAALVALARAAQPDPDDNTKPANSAKPREDRGGGGARPAEPTITRLSPDEYAFLLDHLGPGEHERLLADMMGEAGLPVDTVRRVTVAIIEWGTARPFQTIIELAVVAAEHWRTIRARLLAAGITEPMRVLPHMHAVLDVAEQLLTPESLQRIYRPAVAAGQVQRPPGFSEAEIAASLDAFAAWAGEHDDDA